MSYSFNYVICLGIIGMRFPPFSLYFELKSSFYSSRNILPTVITRMSLSILWMNQSSLVIYEFTRLNGMVTYPLDLSYMDAFQVGYTVKEQRCSLCLLFNNVFNITMKRPKGNNVLHSSVARKIFLLGEFKVFKMDTVTVLIFRLF